MGADGSSDALDVYNGGHDSQIVGNHIHDIGRLCTSTANGECGIFIQQPGVLLEGNYIHEIGRFKLGENGCQPTNSYWMNHDHGVYVDGNTESSSIPGAKDVVIRNNVFVNNARGWAVQLYPGSLPG